MANSRKQLLAEVQNTVWRALQRHIKEGDHLCVGFSGGLDSMVLLALLQAFAPRGAFRLSALHVNHQIHPEAQHWQEFCQQFCREQGIPCSVERVTLGRASGESLEAVARAARYAAYGGQAADFIVLAHHQDDQAETLLIQLLRGAGLPGLSAMPESRLLDPKIPSLRLLRPLLQVTRRDLKACAEVLHLQWVHDPSNDQRAYVRNFLRHAVVPVINERFPSWTAALGRSARHIAQAQRLLDVLAQQDFAVCADATGIRVLAAMALGEDRVTNMLRWWIRQQGAPSCHQAQLQDWLRQAHAAHDRMPELTWNGWVLGRFAGSWQLHQALDGDWVMPALARWPEGVIQIPGAGRLVQEPAMGLGVRRDLLAQGEISLRRRGGGERLRPRSGGPTRTLRYLFQESALPPWWRNALPLVFLGEALICVPGLAVDAAAQTRPGEPGIQLRWEPFVRDAAHEAASPC